MREVAKLSWLTEIRRRNPQIRRVPHKLCWCDGCSEEGIAKQRLGAARGTSVQVQDANTAVRARDHELADLCRKRAMWRGRNLVGDVWRLSPRRAMAPGWHESGSGSGLGLEVEVEVEVRGRGRG